MFQVQTAIFFIYILHPTFDILQISHGLFINNFHYILCTERLAIIENNL